MSEYKNKSREEIIFDERQKTQALRDKWGFPGLPENQRHLYTTRMNAPLVPEGKKILVLGCKGQIAQNVMPLLEFLYPGQVIGADIQEIPNAKDYYTADVRDTKRIKEIIEKEDIGYIFNYAALLSGAADLNPKKAEGINFWAPINLFQLMNELGIDGSHPSSIAAVETHARAYDPPEVVQLREGIRALSSPTITSYPDGSYGEGKLTAESIAGYLTRHGDIQIDTTRYSGILTVKPWPSDGTTEELDKLICAAAYHAVYGTDAPHVRDGKPIFRSDGAYVPAVTEDVIFNMTDTRTLAAASIHLEHKNKKGKEGLGSVHYISEYEVGMGEALATLQKLNPEFNVYFPKNEEEGLNNNKVDRLKKMWPEKCDTRTTEALIGKFKNYTAEQSITDHYNRVVALLREQKIEEDKQGPRLEKYAIADGPIDQDGNKTIRVIIPALSETPNEQGISRKQQAIEVARVRLTAANPKWAVKAIGTTGIINVTVPMGDLEKPINVMPQENWGKFITRMEEAKQQVAAR
jgi:nucleoside-diphosphate-sugar epimerase